MLCCATPKHVEGLSRTWTLRADELKDIRARLADVVAEQAPCSASNARNGRWANKLKPAKTARPSDQSAAEKAAQSVTLVIKAAADASRAARDSRAGARAVALAARGVEPQGEAAAGHDLNK